MIAVVTGNRVGRLAGQRLLAVEAAPRRRMMADRPFRFGVVAAYAQSGEAWIAKARRIEELGFAVLLMPDRLGRLLTPIPALAMAAAATSTLRVGTFVLVNDWRNPVLMAKECATLDFLSGGRFELGLGAGTGEEDFHQAGIAFDRPGVRIKRLAETLSIVKALLGGQEVTTSGTYYSLAGAKGFPPPVQQPRPPILVGGAGDRLLALAAREVDIVAIGSGPDDLGESALARRVALLRQEAGERFSQLELSLNLIAVLGDTPLQPWVHDRIRAIFHLDVEQLVQAQSPFVVTGSIDNMCSQLLSLRERLGVSYVTVPDDMTDAFAPVVERLAGR
jgi:probable F420-dependent oxidoreductase